MQKRFFAIEFCIILLFFLLPPIIFAPAQPAVHVVHVSWQTFVLAGLAIALWWQQKPRRSTATHTDGENASQRRLRFLLNHGQSLLTFGLLVLIAGLLELAARFLFHTNDTVRLLPPSDMLGWANVFLGTLCAAFYEEVLYRAYLPDALAQLCIRKNDTRAAQKTAACEAAAVVLFALAHRYAGWSAVLNALLAGAVLRRCYCKTDSLWANAAAHTAYNSVMLFVCLQ